MSSDPNRNMEELLRAAARERGAQDTRPFALSRANREELQSEVAKVFPGPAPDRQKLTASLWRALWPRLLLGGSVFAVLVAVFTLMNRPSSFPGRPVELAMQKREQSAAGPGLAEDKFTPAPTAAAPQAPPQAATKERPAGAVKEPALRQVAPRDETVVATAPQPRSLALPAEALPPRQKADRQPKPLPVAVAPLPSASQPIIPTRNATAIATKTELAKDVAQPVTQPTTIVMDPATSSVGTLAGRDSLAAGEETRLFLFQNNSPGVALSAKAPASRAPGVSADRTRAASPPSPVLANFQVVQEGGNVRVLDGDGSLYLGTLQLATPVANPAKAKSDLKAGAKAKKPAESASVQNYFLQATGVNQTLRQGVVVTANMAVPVSNVGLGQDGFAGNQTPVAPAKSQQNQNAGQIRNYSAQNGPRSQAAQLNGRAVVAETNEINLNAVSLDR